MKEITTSNGNFLFVEAPDDAYDYKYKVMPDGSQQLVGTIKDNQGNIGTCYIRENPIGKIISTTKDITEEKAESVVNNLIWTNNYRSYLLEEKNVKWYWDLFKFKTAKESLQSLIQANGLDINKNYLILKKNEKRTDTK